MTKFCIGFRLLSGLFLTTGLVHSVAAAPPTAEQILLYKPKQIGVEVTTPTAAETSACTVDLEKGRKFAGDKQATAWVLKDGQGKILRKFHDTTGEGAVNVWAYYRDGEEAYREVASKVKGKADQYRWLGPNGSKWGIDSVGDGRIDTWAAISVEEVSQEILAAVATRDFKRLEALMLTKEELVAFDLPAAESARYRSKLASAAEEFQKTTKALPKLTEKTIWVHLETKVPQTIAFDSIGSKVDLVRYRHATILYQDGDGKEAKHNWLQTGELIQVGRAWRVVQAPVPGVDFDDTATGVGTTDGSRVIIPTGGGKFVEQLKDLDAEYAKKISTPKTVVEYNLKRAEILEQVVRLAKPDQKDMRDVWVRQVAECYAAAAQQGDKGALERLGLWRAALAKDQPAGTLTGYLVYREMTAEYGQKLLVGDLKDKDIQKLQEGWTKLLEKFIADYPSADDAPDALMQLGMVSEFMGKEAEAKNSYTMLVKNFPKSSFARKASGCLTRLSIEGKEFELAGPTLDGGTAFNVTSLRGKPVAVYYWASWNGSATGDFTKIKAALASYSGKVELVCVNLDNAAAEASNFLRTTPVPGTHLFQPGGLESPLAVQYGITVLPNMFLLGADGKVVSRSVQASTLEEELKKLLKEKDAKDK